MTAKLANCLADSMNGDGMGRLFCLYIAMSLLKISLNVHIRLVFIGVVLQ